VENRAAEESSSRLKEHWKKDYESQIKKIETSPPEGGKILMEAGAQEARWGRQKSNEGERDRL